MFLYVIYYVEKTFIARRKHLLRSENIYYAEKIFITWRKHLLRGENIYYADKTFITWRKYLIHGVISGHHLPQFTGKIDQK